MNERLKITEDFTVVDTAGRPVEIEDARGKVYVVFTQEEFQRHVGDDGEFDPAATYPLLDATFGGPDGWDAPGLEVYDEVPTES